MYCQCSDFRRSDCRNPDGCPALRNYPGDMRWTAAEALGLVVCIVASFLLAYGLWRLVR